MYPDYLVHFNPNHDPKNGRFAPGAGGSTVNKIEARLKKADLLDKNYKEYKTESGPAYKRMKSAADTGLKALLKLGDTDVKLDSPEHWDYWFLFEDQTYGQAQVADLANKGKSKEQIKQIIKDSVDFTLHNNTEYPEIPGVYSLYLFNEEADYMPFGDADSFIDACIEAAKENKQVSHSGITQFGNYLCHFNRNHSSKNGQFTSGDGDGDGTRNDHAHRTVDEKKMSNKGYRNASKLFDVQRSTIKNTPTKGASTGSGKYTKEKSSSSRDDHIDSATGKYDRNKTYVDDSKISNKQYSNETTTFNMKRSISSGNVSKGSSFVNGSGVKNRKVGEVDEQKLSNSEEAKEVMRRQFGYVMNDLTEEDEEKKKKKNKKITQSHWGDNYVTGDV